jgi:predicted AlkP superfamily phosphohydrolase/phosphomutase
MPIAHPPLYSIYLRKLHGPFATLGLAEDTWGLNSDVLSEADFLDQAWRIHDERERMLFESLKTSPDGLTVCVFDGPDRIQHMFYRHDVPGHPANLSRENSPHARAIDEMYARMDDLVGRVAKTLHDDALLMVISDHGFCDFSRGVNLNIWLRDHGYLTTRAGAETEDYLAGVDWEKTRAYAFGLNGIYINLAGREHQGIVTSDDAAALRAEICERLTGIIDPERQTVAIRRMYDSREAYTGPYVNEGPDLIVGYEAGYRASWENAVGRVDGPLFSDNTRAWSGDHCVDPEIVPGVLLVNRQLALEPGESPALIDLAPTILQQFGVPVPGHMDGRVIPINESRAATAKAKTPVQHEPAMAGSAP